MFINKRFDQDRPYVSVVVPVYNVQEFLSECLDSLVSQSLKNIEIICVNDGSTDDSLSVLRSYEEKDPRVKVLTKENRGYGHTMNLGFSAAKGEYIGICESDDFADKHMYEDMYRFAKKKKLDLLKANYYEHSETGDALQRPFDEFRYREVFDPRIYQGPLTALPVIWSALYKRDLIVSNGIRFNETPGASYQDTSFVHQVWMAARRVAILEKGYLHYRVDNANSSVKSSAKVFAVCDEYALSESFMRKDPERVAAFAPILNLLKLGTYRWNFNRITDESRPAFVKKMSEEFSRAKEDGSLDRAMFCDRDWEQVGLLIDDPDKFVEMYSGGM